LPSGGSNFGLTNAKLKHNVDSLTRQFIAYNQLDSLTTSVPSEMVFASASGLDPHISPEAAFLQVNRIAKARKFNTVQKQKLMQCIKDLTEHPQFFCLGDERINVLLLNLATDKINN
jgi:K+-transporting ATPase ATPase C chain